MLLKSVQFEVAVDYHQFYVWDSAMNPDAPDNYTDEDVQRRIKTGQFVVVIQPERSMPVPVCLEIHDAEPVLRTDDWDHVAEASLHLPSGGLQVHECLGGAVADFVVAPGWYRVRSMHGGFETIASVGTDGNDFYNVALWPAEPAEVVVVKQYIGNRR